MSDQSQGGSNAGNGAGSKGEIQRSGIDWANDDAAWQAVKDGMDEQSATGVSQEMAPAMAGYYDDVPASSNEYQLSAPYGSNADPGQVEALRGLFHAAGIPKGIARYAFDSFWQTTNGQPLDDAAMIKAAEKAERSLRSTWGDGYDAKLKAANSVIESLPPEQRAQAMALLERTGLGNDAVFISKLAQLGEYRAAKAKG